ncbi:hypothetical protein WN944_013247 [Citrus x changshan-huyou]|uniref:Uncharacterized protein n=1 Tax=Citrus x changshan-huyou TaxID=2935761 RepID=A0AAP0QKB5_9ROSI
MRFCRGSVLLDIIILGISTICFHVLILSQCEYHKLYPYFINLDDKFRLTK